VIFGIDVNALTRSQRTGTERYLLAVLREMMSLPLREGEKMILYSSAKVADLGDLPPGWQWRIIKWPLRKGWTHGRLSWELLLAPPDVFWSPVHEIPFMHRCAKIVSTVHDVAFRRLPAVYSPQGTARQEWAISRIGKEADAIISVSQTTKNDLIDLYQLPAEKIFVTHLAPEIRKQFLADRPKTVSPSPYFLTIGRLEKKKNIANLVRAFGRIGGNAKLILAGSWGFGAEEIKQAIAESGASDRIETPGYVSDEEANRLLAGATAYLFPSYYEGFGLPALESMVAGAPLIAADIPALREVAGAAALFVAPADLDGWANAMQQLATDENLRHELIQKGNTRAQAFSWPQTAQNTWEVLRQVAYGKSHV
jgi:glycosyltransferase involved in cell wall biosynthesis